MNKDIHETAERIVRSEVIVCLSALVSQCAGEGEGELGEIASELFYPVQDWEEAAIQEGWHLDGADDTWQRKNTDGSMLREYTAREACDYDGIEPYEREIFEHWAISDWLGRKLLARGERVEFDFYGLTVWGRTTTGQAIAIDSVIEDIAAEMSRARGKAA